MIRNLLVIEDPRDWPEQEPGAEVVLAEDYLTNPSWSTSRSVRVFNLCRSYRYQSLGYYVSLLAAARGHKPLPSVSTIADFRLVSLLRLAGDTLDELIQRALHPLQGKTFTLSVYFGKNVARRYDQLSGRLFRMFPAPLVKYTFAHDEEEGWKLRGVKPLALSDIPEDHRPDLLQYAREFFEKRRITASELGSTTRYSLAVLHNPAEEQAPSDEKTLNRIIRVADKMDVGVELITKDDYGRLAEFDALFIRETTNVNHHTYRFARRAQAEGLVVIDDPDSILRCSNKVYLAELLTRAKIPTPKTVTITRRNIEEKAGELPFPCIVKQPDSAFSLGVKKANSREEFLSIAREMMQNSELIVVQEFLPTEYDWRVGVLDNEPLYVCKYHMARKHWQIVARDEKGGTRWGRVETLPVWQAPPHVVKTALAAANTIGNSLYGVDVKDVNGTAFIMEVNDNPDIMVGYEDAVLKDELYEKIVSVFVRRIEKRREGTNTK